MNWWEFLIIQIGLHFLRIQWWIVTVLEWSLTSISGCCLFAFSLINVYSDSFQLALKYLKDTEVNIWNILVMTGDFNIRDNLWDPLYPHHFSLSDDLFIIADCFNLGLSVSTNWVPTRYSDNIQEANSVINLMFLQFGSSKMDNHSIHPD